MTSNYGKIIKDNLTRIYANLPEKLDKALPAERKGNVFLFKAFGQDCSLEPEKIKDEEFPASVTCLFSQNALSFMPLDGLADVAEYTSKAIIQLLKGNR